jgi:aminoglycoside/choline kinase family phosphotransferase
VLTDLGRIGYLDALNADPSLADTLMRPVLDVLVKWQLSSRASTLPPYDANLLRRELDLFPEWFIGRHLGFELADEDKVMLDRTFKFLINSALAQPKVFVHRDFMPRNLMVVESAERLTPGVIDFQDAVCGPITYDVVSLFRDAFISWNEEQEIDWVVRYWEKARAAGLPVREDFGDFWREYELMGLQRHLKVLGIFCRLKYRDGKDKYIEDLPRFMNYARKTASRYAALKPLLTLLDTLDGKSAEVGYTF